MLDEMCSAQKFQLKSDYSSTNMTVANCFLRICILQYVLCRLETIAQLLMLQGMVPIVFTFLYNGVIFSADNTGHDEAGENWENGVRR